MIEEPTDDIRNEFDRHVLNSMGQRSNMHDAMSQPSRSPLPLDSFRRPRSTGHYLVSPSPRTKRLHKKREMIDSNSRASSVLSSNSSGSSSSSGTGSRTSLASSRNSNNISFSPSFPNKDKLYESGPASAVDSSNWGILDHQVQNRLQRMKADLQRIPEKVIAFVQKKEIPLHQKKTNVLMNQLKKLKSKRVALENEIPMIINTVRAQKEPNDAYTRCWDPKTGVKMKVKDIENTCFQLENDIVTVQNKNFYPIKMKKIYKNMKSRYTKDISSLAAKVKNIKHRIKTMKSKKMLQITTLTDIKHMNVTIEKDIDFLNEQKAMNRMHYQRQLVEVETEHKEYIVMLKIEVKGTDRRTKIQIEAKLQEEAEAQIKLDVRRVETLTARGAKGWLQQSIKNSIPTQRAIKRLQDTDMLRDPIELADYWKTLKSRTNEIDASLNDLKLDIERKKSILLKLDEQYKEASKSIHLFIKEEDEINLWDIQESIDEETRTVSE